MNPEVHKKFLEMMKLLNEGLTRSEFEKAFRDLMAVVVKLEAKAFEKIGKAETKALQNVESAQDKLTKLVEQMALASDKSFEKLKAEVVKKLQEVDSAVAEITDGDDGEDADDMEIVERVLSLIHIPTIEELEKDIPKLGEPIRDALELLQGDERLDASAIKGLDEMVKSLAPVQGGGGTSTLGVRQAFKYIAHTETPVGDIDGVNTVYTVTHDIWWIAGFTINKANIAEQYNFTYSGRTITFSTPLPASYSGTDFEIKYIG